MTRLNLLETLSNNKVQDILEEMGMLENGNCPYTAEEIFKTGVEYAQNHIESNEVFIDKACEWLRENANFSVNDNTGSLDEQDLIKRFQQAMKGE